MKSTKLLSWEVGFIPFLMGAICGTAMGVGLYSETLRYDRQQIHNAAEKQKVVAAEEVRKLKEELTDEAILRSSELAYQAKQKEDELHTAFEQRLTSAGACMKQQDYIDQLMAEVETVRHTFGSALGKCVDKSRALTAELKALKVGAK
jgi:hypothetical protein